MKANINLFWILSVFFVLATILYIMWGLADPNYNHADWTGYFALGLSAVLWALIAFYLGRVHGAQGGELPEDRVDASIDDGDPESGFFSPWSWWPIMLAGSAALLFLGLAIGFWIAIVAVFLGIISLVGWTYEYYRGYFAR